MTRRAPCCGFAIALAVALLLSLPGADARAGGLYRWVTSDGRVEIGPTPPPGVSAVPWIPGQPETPPDGVSPTRPAAAAPAAAAPADAPPAPRAPRSSGPALRRPKNARPKAGSEDCAKLGDVARNLAHQVSATEREIAQLEAKLEKLEASEVAYSRTDCARNGANGLPTGCQSGTFDRDTQIAQTQEAIERAQEKLDQAEEKARHAGVPQKCQ